MDYLLHQSWRNTVTHLLCRTRRQVEQLVEGQRKSHNKFNRVTLTISDLPLGSRGDEPAEGDAFARGNFVQQLSTPHFLI